MRKGLQSIENQKGEENALAKAPRRKVFHRYGMVLVRDLIRTDPMNPDRKRSCLLCALASLREKKALRSIENQKGEENALAKAPRRKGFSIGKVW